MRWKVHWRTQNTWNSAQKKHASLGLLTSYSRQALGPLTGIVRNQDQEVTAVRSPASSTNVFNNLTIAFECSLNWCRAWCRNLPPNPTQKALLASCASHPAGRVNSAPAILGAHCFIAGGGRALRPRETALLHAGRWSALFYTRNGDCRL